MSLLCTSTIIRYQDVKELIGLTEMHVSPGLLHCQVQGSPQKVRAISSDTPHRLVTED